MKIKKVADGQYFITKSNVKGLPEQVFRAVYSSANRASINLGCVEVPPELIGKRLMFKIVFAST